MVADKGLSYIGVNRSSDVGSTPPFDRPAPTRRTHVDVEEHVMAPTQQLDGRPERAPIQRVPATAASKDIEEDGALDCTEREPVPHEEGAA